VDRTTDFEHGLPFHEARSNGSGEPDPLVLDKQALVLQVRGQGLVVLTGCGHAGAVNIARHALRLAGTDRLHAMLGGFHLTGAAFEPNIEPTVAAFVHLRRHVGGPMSRGRGTTPLDPSKGLQPVHRRGPRRHGAGGLPGRRRTDGIGHLLLAVLAVEHGTGVLAGHGVTPAAVEAHLTEDRNPEV
jgi:hypothetical protein